jgi:hypothetical protein
LLNICDCRDDQGFCSIECRNRQMVLDELRELEASSNERLKSYAHCSTTAKLHNFFIFLIFLLCTNFVLNR